MVGATIHVDVVSAESAIFSGEAEFVVLPREVGELAMLAAPRPRGDGAQFGCYDK